MTTPKRCEVYGLPPCNLWMTGCEGHCHCNGHSSPPPRPDEWEKEFDEKWPKNDYAGGFCDGSTWNRKPELIKSFISSLLLSYGKERERELFRKCREAVEEAPVGWTKYTEHTKAITLSALDTVNPDKSSPDAGREE